MRNNEEHSGEPSVGLVPTQVQILLPAFILNVISFRIYLITFAHTKVLIIVRLFSAFSIF